MQEVWALKLTTGTDADPADSALKLTVKKGDISGFAEGIRDVVNGAVVTWDVILTYSDQEPYSTQSGDCDDDHTGDHHCHSRQYPNPCV